MNITIKKEAVTMQNATNIAVVGSGISGLACAWLLSQGYRVTLFEAAPRLGGHTNTVDVTVDGKTHPVDTGFLVFNEKTYPNLIALFDTLGVDSVQTEMSFAVSMDGGRLEYAGSNLAGLLAQPSNLARPRFYAMMADLLRFYRQAPRDLGRLEGLAIMAGTLVYNADGEETLLNGEWSVGFLYDDEVD